MARQLATTATQPVGCGCSGREVFTKVGTNVGSIVGTPIEHSHSVFSSFLLVFRLLSPQDSPQLELLPLP